MDPLEQQGALRGDLSAAPRARGASTAAVRAARIWKSTRRRPHLDEARPTACRPARSGRIGLDVYRAQPEHPLRAHRARDGERRLSLRRRRRSVAEDVERQPAADVLQPDPHRSDQRPAHLRARRRSSTSPTTAARRSSSNGADCTPTITRCGSTRRTPNHVIDGNDGGVGISYDRARPGRRSTNMDLGAVLPRRASTWRRRINVCGGMQDNYTWCGPSAVRSRRHRQRRLVPDPGRRRLRRADGSATTRASSTPSRRTATSSRVDRVTNERKSIRPLPADAASRRCAGTGTRRSLLSPHDPATIYVGANKVFRSTDRGQSWTPISPDLTQNTDREGAVADGRDRQGDHASPRTTACSRTATSCTLAESPKQAGVLYAGTDDGKVHMTKDGGKTWTNITSRSSRACRRTRTCRGCRPSRARRQRVYATFDNHRADDYGHLRLRQRRRRQQLPLDRRGHSEGPRGHVDGRGSEEPERALLGHRDRPVRQPGPRRPVDARQGQPADGADPRDRHPPARQRHDPRHARPQHLDPRRRRRRCSSRPRR